MVAYCSIMTLLLAFFIILQAFAPEQNAGLFYAGQGSFIRALKTFGLGGVLPPQGSMRLGDKTGARYMSTEGGDDPSMARRIDPEYESAQQALEALDDRFDVNEPKDLTGWRATLATPFDYQRDISDMSPDEEEFCEELAWRLAPLLFARGFVIRISAEVQCEPREELEQTKSALSSAQQLRKRIIMSMAPAARPTAARRLYCFCRKARQDSGRIGPLARRLRVDILLTKPNVQRVEDATIESDGSSD